MAKYDIAVIGLGRFGSALAQSLESEGRRVLGVDIDEKVVNSLAEDIHSPETRRPCGSSASPPTPSSCSA